MPHDPSFDSPVLTIGGDTSYDALSDPYDGTVVKVQPSAGQLAQGLRPSYQLAAQHRNWIDNQIALILAALISNDVIHETRLDADELELADHETRITTAETWISTKSPRIRIYPYTSDGTFVVPARCVAAFSYGAGGGGAGGGGHLGDNHVDRWIAGGAGGGGSLATLIPLIGCVPTETLHVTVGLGGTQQGIGATGGSGGDSIVWRTGLNLAIHAGAEGGRGSIGGMAHSGWTHYTMGGRSVRGGQTMLLGPTGQGIRFDMSTGGSLSIYGNTGQFDGQIQSLYLMMEAAQGGWGAGGSFNPVAGAGAMNPIGGFAGGAAGAKGFDGDPNAPPGDPTKRGGGGGGGGGAGPWGVGGVGGAGTAGEASNSTTGGSALVNTGAGGGGQGSAGYVDVVGFPSVAGDVAGDGGSGRVYIITVEESP